MGRQRWQPSTTGTTEPLRREKPVQPSPIVILVQRPRCVGRIESGAEPIAFAVGHWSVRGAPVGRRDRQVTAHPSRLLGVCADIARRRDQTVRMATATQREPADRGALPPRSCDQGRSSGLGARRTTSVIGHRLAAADLVPSGDRPVAFWLIGSPFVDRGRRRQQAAAGEVISAALTAEADDLPPVPAGSTLNTRRTQPAAGLAAGCWRQQGRPVQRLRRVDRRHGTRGPHRRAVCARRVLHHELGLHDQ